jgi:hypothetical protein
MTRKLLVVGLIASAFMLFASSGAAVAGDEKTIKGSDSGLFVTTPLEFPFVLTQDVTTGHGTHLGKYTVVAQEIINLLTLEVTEGSFTITAANGDTIVGTYSGQAAFASPTLITYLVSGPITGGTGRFAGATGSITFAGSGDLVTGVLSETLTATISKKNR